MRLTPLAAIAAACVLTLTACGDDGDDPKSSDAKDTPSASDAPTDLPTDFPTDLPSETKAPKPNEELVKQVCESLDPAAVGDALGGEVEAGPLGANACSFSDQGGEHALAISYVQLATVGGLDAYKQTLSVMAGGDLEEVSGAGDSAFAGGTEGSGTGAVVVGDDLLQLLVVPGAGASADDAKAAAVELVELVGAAL